MRLRIAVMLLAGALAIAAGLMPAAPVQACDLCRMVLTSRKGPFAIVLAREHGTAPGPSTDSPREPRLRIRIVNASSRPLVVGPSSRIFLNAVSPFYKARTPVDVVPQGRDRIIAPGASVTFHTAYLYDLKKPGAYRFDVSYRNVDSNILAYTVK